MVTAQGDIAGQRAGNVLGPFQCQREGPGIQQRHVRALA